MDIRMVINLYRLWIPWTGFKIAKNSDTIKADLLFWKERYNFKEKSAFRAFCYFMLYKKEFRNVLYYRLASGGFFSRIFRALSIICFKPLESLDISTPNIGPGLFILHGLGTIIAAESIGSNFTAFQQVTIGYIDDKKPVIKDNVTAFCGSKVLGGITVGNNVRIGANAVVIKDVADDSTVVGVPGHVVRKKKQ